MSQDLLLRCSLVEQAHQRGMLPARKVKRFQSLTLQAPVKYPPLLNPNYTESAANSIGLILLMYPSRSI
jgi:hypothetical protein